MFNEFFMVSANFYAEESTGALLAQRGSCFRMVTCCLVLVMGVAAARASGESAKESISN